MLLQEQSSGSCRGGDVDAAMGERQQTNSAQRRYSRVYFLFFLRKIRNERKADTLTTRGWTRRESTHGTKIKQQQEDEACESRGEGTHRGSRDGGWLPVGADVGHMRMRHEQHSDK